MRGRRRSGHRLWRHERTYVSLIVTSCVLGFFLTGCRRASKPDFEAEYRDIQSTLTRGDLAGAEQKAHKNTVQLVGQNSELSWKFRLLEARIEVLQGKGADALALLTPELPAPLANGDMAIQREMLLAMSYARLGQLPRAVLSLQKAQAICDQTHSPQQAELSSFQGIINLHNDDLAGAEASFRKALELAKQQKDSFLQSTILLNLGVVALLKEHYDEALYWSNAASDIARAVGAQLILEKALGNVGWDYYELGDFEKALDNSQQAELQAEKLGATYDQVGWLSTSGSAEYKLGYLKDAEKSYRQSLALAESIQNQEAIFHADTDLAFLLFQLGSFDQARTKCNEALQVAEAMGSKSAEAEPMFVKALLAEKTGDRQQAEEILRTLEAESDDSPSLRWKVENEMAKISQSSGDNAVAAQWYRKSIDTFERQRSSLSDEELKLPFFTNASQLYGDYAEYLVHSARPEEALKLVDRGRARTLEEGLGMTAKDSPSRSEASVNPEEVARKLHATILVYWLGVDESYLWAITPVQNRCFKLPKESEISAQVRAYKKAILASSDPLTAGNGGGRALFDLLVAPAQSLIPRDSKVFVIADGSLNQLNFETLVAPAPAPHYWIDEVTVTNGDSLRMLQAFASRPRSNAGNGLLLIGDPISPGAVYGELPNARQEIETVENHFRANQREILTREQALPSAYADSHPERFSYIHFVAHATASSLSPLDSAVILTRTPGNAESFKLYARDIVHYPLHAELVTVSACYGSGSRAYAGEGLVGLSWAFLRAGAHHVVAALWEVSDSAAPPIMERLYGGLQAGMPPDEALRAAKLSLVHSQGTFRKPLYWASFQLYAGS